MIDFDYHVKTVTAYAFYVGQVRGLVRLLEKDNITPQEFIARQREADAALQVKLATRD